MNHFHPFSRVMYGHVKWPEGNHRLKTFHPRLHLVLELPTLELSGGKSGSVKAWNEFCESCWNCHGCHGKKPFVYIDIHTYMSYIYIYVIYICHIYIYLYPNSKLGCENKYSINIGNGISLGWSWGMAISPVQKMRISWSTRTGHCKEGCNVWPTKLAF